MRRTGPGHPSPASGLQQAFDSAAGDDSTVGGRLRANRRPATLRPQAASNRWNQVGRQPFRRPTTRAGRCSRARGARRQVDGFLRDRTLYRLGLPACAAMSGHGDAVRRGPRPFAGPGRESRAKLRAPDLGAVSGEQQDRRGRHFPDHVADERPVRRGSGSCDPSSSGDSTDGTAAGLWERFRACLGWCREGARAGRSARAVPAGAIALASERPNRSRVQERLADLGDAATDSACRASDPCGSTCAPPAMAFATGFEH